MSKSTYMSALVLVEWSPPGPKIYAILPAASKGFIDASLAENGIEILKDDQFTLPKSSKLAVLELVMEFSKTEGAFVGFCTNEVSKDLLKSLLNKTPGVWESLTNRFVSDYALWDIHCSAFAAEEESNLRAVKKLLAANVEMTLLHTKGGSLLHLAANQGSHGRRLIELLCEHGADVNSTLRDGATPLHIAVVSNYNDDGDTRSVQKLLEKGARLDAAMRNGYTPLHEAANAGCLSVVKLLLAHGAKVDARANDDWTPLHSAAEVGWLGVVQLLVERGAELTAKTKDDMTLLHLAAIQQKSYLYVPLVKWLFQNGVDIHATDVKGNTPLHYAVKELPHVLKLLVERGADINVENKDGETALLLAVTKNVKASFEHLLSFNPDFNVPGNRKAFYVALRKTKEARGMAKQMEEKGFRVLAKDAGEPDILFHALHKGLLEIVRCLLEFGADVNQHHTFMSLKMTPLHYAIRRNQKDMVRLLLDFGANVHEKRGQRIQHSPIEEAVEYADIEVVNMLVAEGINVRDTPTLLHLATKSWGTEAYEKSFAVVKLLLGEGFDWNAKNSKGETPLWNVIQRHNTKALEIMVSFGAQVNYCNLAGKMNSSPAFLHAFLSNYFILPSPAEETVLKKFLAFNFNPRHTNIRQCVKTVAEHIIKLEAVYENISAGSFFSRSDLGLDGFKSQCKVEVETMKLETVGCADLTVFDVLNKNPTQIARCVRNGRLFEVLKTCDFQSKFPIYSSILTARCRNGCLRRERLNQCIKILNALCPQFKCLPGELKGIIMDFLSDRDLFIFQKAVSMK